MFFPGCSFQRKSTPTRHWNNQNWMKLRGNTPCIQHIKCHDRRTVNKGYWRLRQLWQRLLYDIKNGTHKHQISVHQIKKHSWHQNIIKYQQIPSNIKKYHNLCLVASFKHQKISCRKGLSFTEDAAGSMVPCVFWKACGAEISSIWKGSPQKGQTVGLN